jgi:hypothetical protein
MRDAERGIPDDCVWHNAAHRRPRIFLKPDAVLAAAKRHGISPAVAPNSYEQGMDGTTPPTVSAANSEDSEVAGVTPPRLDERTSVSEVRGVDSSKVSETDLRERAHQAELSLAREQGAHALTSTFLHQATIDLEREKTKVQGLLAVIANSGSDVTSVLDMLNLAGSDRSSDPEP